MKMNDVTSGLLLFAFAVILFLAAKGLPNPAAQTYGPAFFPTWIAMGIGVAALVMVATSLGQLRRQPLLQLDDWVRVPSAVLRFLLVPVAVVAYVVLVDWLGFAFAGGLVLGGLLLGFGTRPLVALCSTVLVIAVIWLFFVWLLRVPLPAGTLF